MDSAYDDPMIRSHSQSLGHVPLIDVNPRANKELKQELEAEAKRRQLLGHKLAEEVRYNERTTAERANARIKDEFGGRNVRVRGNAKFMCPPHVRHAGAHHRPAPALRHLRACQESTALSERR